MAMKKEFTWFSKWPELTSLGLPDFVAVNDLITVPEGSLATGQLRMVRFRGSLNVFMDGLLAGSIDCHLWHGLVMVDSELFSANRTRIIQSSGVMADNDDNDWWVWREPISFMPTGLPVQAGLDWMISVEFDWQLRGGVGTNMEIGKTFAYVFQAVGQAGAPQTMWSDISFNLSGLELYVGY